jgi:hypothetical protein
MKREFMLLVRNTGDEKKQLAPEAHLAFVKKCEAYIAGLIENGNLVAAQPLLREGIVLSKKGDGWNTLPVNPGQDMIQVGYYHVLATSIDEAIAIAKNNPEFEYTASASVEVRPIKMKETQTGFIYPEQRKH